MTILQQEKLSNTIKTITTLFAVIITILTIVWAVSAQNTKFDAGFQKIETIDRVVQKHDIEIAILKNDIAYIRETVTEIKQEVKRQ